ncbi:MAG: 50S ribosomal protein L18 [Gemmataceae bacterium]
MNKQKSLARQRLRRRYRVRKKIFGTPERPRLSVFRSNKHIYAQIIDDTRGVTLVAASSLSKNSGVSYGGNVAAAKHVGLKLAQMAREQGITKVAFDRGCYKYHGRVKALAEGAREGGLLF